MGHVDGLFFVIAGIVGLVTGVFATLLFLWNERRERVAPVGPPADLDEGFVRALAVLRSAAVVVGEADEIVRASAPAYALGLVRHDALAHRAVEDMVAEVRRTGEILDVEIELPRGPSGRGDVLLQVRVAQVDGRNVLVLAEDRTEARRLEAIRRDFVVNISHELKTPVGALALLAETVHDAADDPEAVRRFAGRMQQESARLGALVHEVIELSRLQSASALTQVQAVAVRGIVEESIDRARTTATGRNIRLASAGDLDAAVYGDHNLLVTALRNLLDNAVNYSPDGSSVSVGVRRALDFVEISVVDQGVGIARDVQDRIFERFYRVDPARSRETGGTGLGLSIVKHVVADHGGEMTIWSQPGQGSTFTMKIPAAHIAPAGPTEALAPAGPAAEEEEDA
ncbi:sensor histidine kinase [Sanguibacter sp. A247]|uniref:sensor histidine kinase n=1 Tax=unclassified Sanguibacter TaxID=2645534 RepID=UPI003FD7669C